MAKTSLGKPIDVDSLLGDNPNLRGVRKDGVYETPGQHEYDGMLFTGRVFASELERIRNHLQLHTGDVVSSGHVKTGSSWVNEIIFLICNDANVDLASKLPPFEKLPFLDYNFTGKPETVAQVDSMPPPRLLKSHLPPRYYQQNLNKLEQGPKFVITMRNPKDSLVSFYHFYRNNPDFGLFDGDWNEFFDLFRSRRTTNGEMFDFTTEWWALKDHPNVLIVKYEDLKKDSVKEIEKIAHFLGYELTSSQIRTIADATTFENMKKQSSHDAFGSKDDADRAFFRKGVVGGWREYFSSDQNIYVDKCVDLKYAPVGLTFDFVLP